MAIALEHMIKLRELVPLEREYSSMAKLWVLDTRNGGKYSNLIVRIK